MTPLESQFHDRCQIARYLLDISKTVEFGSYREELENILHENTLAIKAYEQLDVKLRTFYNDQHIENIQKVDPTSCNYMDEAQQELITNYEEAELKNQRSIGFWRGVILCMLVFAIGYYAKPYFNFILKSPQHEKRNQPNSVRN